MKEKSYKLDIFETLNAIDRRDHEYLNKKSEDERKAFAPPVVLRWTSCVTGNAAEYYILAANRANIHFHDIHQHPDLQYRLLASCGIGSRQTHKWVTGTKSSSKKARQFVADQFPMASLEEIDILMKSFTKESFSEFLIDTGCPQKDAKDLVQSFEKERT